ncbi:MAG: ABC transporter ATP-binding protein [Gemmataceae bacterium]
MSATPVAEFIDVVKDFRLGLLRRRTVRAVAGVTFRVNPGEIFGLLGPNRAGKTTLVKLLLSLSHPTAGSVVRLGQPVKDRSTLGRIGYVHENHAFPRYLSAAGLLEYYGSLSLIPYEMIKQRVPKLLEKVGLADRQRDTISTFSKGMIQRLGLAQALLNEPDLLVLDEPNEGLDLVGRKIVFDTIAEQKQKGRTVILVSHVLHEVEQYCDRVAVLQEGKLVHLGTVTELTHRGTKDGKAQSLEQALQGIYQKAPK